MLLYRCYVLLLSEDFAYIVTWLLHFFHADILQDAAPEQAEPIRFSASFMPFMHGSARWLCGLPSTARDVSKTRTKT